MPAFEFEGKAEQDMRTLEIYINESLEEHLPHISLGKDSKHACHNALLSTET